MDRGQIGSDGKAVALHVVSDSEQEHVSVIIPRQNMVEMSVVSRAPLTLKFKYAIDQNVPVRARNMISRTKCSFQFHQHNLKYIDIVISLLEANISSKYTALHL